MISPLRQASGLAFPAGRAPGFDPTHVALGVASPGATAFVCQFSAVASGPNFIDLMGAGKAGTVTGGPLAASIHGVLGPCVSFAGGASNQYVSFRTWAGGGFNRTFAAVLMFNSPIGSGTVYPCVISDSANGASAGWLLRVDQPAWNWSVVAPGIADFTFGFAPAPNVPYFVAMSTGGSSGGVTSLVQVRLDTGQTRLVNLGVVASNPLPQSGGATLGSGVTGFFGGKIAAAMSAPRYLSPQRLLAWAQDPWSFWYPAAPYAVKGTAAIAPTPASAQMNGVGSMSAAGSTVVIHSGAAQMNGVGSLTAASLALITRSGTARMDGSGALAANGASEIVLPPVGPYYPPPEQGPLYLREMTYRHRFLGKSFDPTIVVTQDRPGPLRIVEFEGWVD